jgi:hypothetical protein
MRQCIAKIGPKSVIVTNKAARQTPVAGRQRLAISIDQVSGSDAGTLLGGFKIGIGRTDARCLIWRAEQRRQRRIKRQQAGQGFMAGQRGSATSKSISRWVEGGVRCRDKC